MVCGLITMQAVDSCRTFFSGSCDNVACKKTRAIDVHSDKSCKAEEAYHGRMDVFDMFIVRYKMGKQVENHILSSLKQYIANIWHPIAQFTHIATSPGVTRRAHR